MKSLNEFSRLVDIEKAAKEEKEIHLVATPSECHALMKRFDLKNLKSLQAGLTILRLKSPSVFCLKGLIKATLTQVCVVSLEDKEQEVNQPIEVLIKPKHLINVRGEPEEEAIEFFEGETLDVGELVAQFFYMGLDSYPKIMSLSSQDETSTQSYRPFQHLEEILKKR